MPRLRWIIQNSLAYNIIIAGISSCRKFLGIEQSFEYRLFNKKITAVSKNIQKYLVEIPEYRSQSIDLTFSMKVFMEIAQIQRLFI